MPINEAEALVLRTHPLSEADLIVVLYTREFGKIRVVAKHARRIKARFSGTLGLMTHLRVVYYERENRDLTYLKSCDLLESFFDLQAEYKYQVVFSYLAEVVDALFPDREPNDKVFRLLLAMLKAGKSHCDPIWLLAYFNLWILRLSGLLPSLSRCVQCGRELAESGGAFAPSEGKIFCLECRPRGGQRVSSDLVTLFQRCLSLPLEKVEESGRGNISELNNVMEKLVLKAVDKPLKTLELLRSNLYSDPIQPLGKTRRIP